MHLFFLFAVSFVAWLISALAGGGSALVVLPAVGFILDARAIAPAVTTGMLLGNSQRVLHFWRHVDWPLTRWYLPGAVIGAVLGAYLFTQIHLDWLQLLMGVFLLVTVVTFLVSRKDRIFPVSPWHFLPLGFLYALISGLVGSSGPLMNPFYLNYGLLKEPMIATKAAHVVGVHIVKLVAYGVLGVLHPQYLGYGLLIGVAAIPANWASQYFLDRMSDRQFRHLVLATMTVSGLFMTWSVLGDFLIKPEVVFGVTG
ncbi:permease [Leptolyngbya sp. 'hensonii']|uniref:sulfite exporter TauE/SafE family protein n=1 Tax=Leptolyngbya sp. 'hensonii' TaxID=1922337 RepID=UPI00094FA0EA|nr:sulfite exporter TauE/SafE family protein [Leptolyngbya sp. 'hensonii']OLP17869.1 permease [Leptolyngbya sp. 'hensonii']